MSEALYRAMIDAWNARDVERMLELCHPELEFRPILGDVEGDAYHGHDGLRRYFVDLDETFRDARMEIDEVEEIGDWVVARQHVSGAGTGSGIPFEGTVANAMRFADGLCVVAVTARTREELLSVAGIE